MFAVRRVPPHFSVPPDNVDVMPGGSVNLTCIAVGSPTPIVRWRLGSVDLTREDAAPVSKNILTLTNVRQTATYTCVATSELGNIDHHAEVRVKGQSYFIRYKVYSYNLTFVVHDLGVWIDAELSMRDHISRSTRTCCSHFRPSQIYQNASWTGRDCPARMRSIVLSRVDYCNAVYAGLPPVTLVHWTTHVVQR